MRISEPAAGERIQTDAVKLNLGAGDILIAGYDNSFDAKQGRAIYPLDMPDNSVDEIRASHCLEHLSIADGMAAVRDWVRALKPGGLLKIAVPDFETIAKAYLSGYPQATAAYVMGGQIDADDFHRAIFDREHLEEIMRGSLLDGIHLWTSDVQDCAALPISLNLAGYKRAPRPKIEAVMSVPRLGFLDNAFCMIGLAAMHISPRKITGAYWGQCIERGIDEALAAGADLVLTVDYDTVFTPREILDLVAIMRAHPEIDALAPLQQHRSSGNPLFVIRADDGKVRSGFEPGFFDSTVIPVDTAHFGCTLIRAAAFEKLKRPLFWSKPAPDGTWGDGRLDDDLYFWRQFTAAGLQVAITPRVIVGHAELMVMWPGEDMTTMYQRPSDFWSDGRPAKAWR